MGEREGVMEDNYILSFLILLDVRRRFTILEVCLNEINNNDILIQFK